MATRIGVGIAGSGFVARFHVQSWRGVRDADITAIYSRNRKAAEELASLCRELDARLIRPRRAAQPPAAPAGSVRSTTGAVAHRGEDPPHDGGIAIAADSVQRGVIIWRPASRSRFGGLAFHDLDDVEGSHVRHDPPSPWTCSGPRTAVTRFGTPGPHLVSRASYRRWHRRIFLPISAEQATRILIPDRARLPGRRRSGRVARPGERDASDPGRARLV